MAIKNATNNGLSYGQKALGDESYTFRIQVDDESELSNQRLYFLKEFFENILKLQGYRISPEKSDNNYILTTKSEGIIEENYQKIVCGVVKNPENKSKDKSTTWNSYLTGKKEELKKLNSHKYQNDDSEEDDEDNIKQIATIGVKFAFLSVKPSRCVLLKKSQNSDDTMKGIFSFFFQKRNIMFDVSKNTERSQKFVY